jgi:hypothetical protein
MIGIWRLVVGATLVGCCGAIWLMPDFVQAGIGSCSTEEVRDLRDEGFSAKDIRELCKKDSAGFKAAVRKAKNIGEFEALLSVE